MIVERYRVEGVIARGGMAVVYRVKHLQLGSTHALKLLHGLDPLVRDRLLREGRVQADMRHPNLVPVTDVVAVGGQPGLIMDFVRGPSLDVLLARRRLTLEQIDLLAQGILAGVAEAHRHGVFHRDLKPANILLEVGSDRLIPKVADFGLAKVLHGQDDLRTRSGVSLGTPAYMAPEQIRGARHVDQRADVWSLGAVFYEMISGVRPFDGPDNLAIMQAVGLGRYRPLRDFVPGVPDRMERAVVGALHVEPGDRFADCGDFAVAWLGRQPGRGAFNDSLLGDITDMAARPRSLAALAVEITQDLGATWEGDDLSLPPASVDPPPGARRTPGPALPRNLPKVVDRDAETQVLAVEPMPLEGAPPDLRDGEDLFDRTFIHRIHRQYGVLAAASAVLVTALVVIAFGVGALALGVWWTSPPAEPEGPSVESVIGPRD